MVSQIAMMGELLHRIELIGVLVAGMISTPELSSAQQASVPSRIVRIERGQVEVERQGNADRVTVRNERGEVEAESWCPIDFGTYDELVAFFKSLVAATESTSAADVSRLVRYPLRVNGPTASVRTDRELRQQYGNVFTPAVRQAIQGAVPEAVFCRNGAAMIGNGVVWASARRGRVALDVVNR